MDIIDAMKSQANLHRLCSQVFGEENADLHVQRILMRREEEARKTASRLGAMVPEINRVFGHEL